MKLKTIYEFNDPPHIGPAADQYHEFQTPESFKELLDELNRRVQNGWEQVDKTFQELRDAVQATETIPNYLLPRYWWRGVPWYNVIVPWDIRTLIFHKIYKIERTIEVELDEATKTIRDIIQQLHILRRGVLTGIKEHKTQIIGLTAEFREHQELFKPFIEKLPALYKEFTSYMNYLLRTVRIIETVIYGKNYKKSPL